jgi:hypothetical protein
MIGQHQDSPRFSGDFAGRGYDMRDLIITAVSSAAIIIASYLNFLRFNEYPLLRPEVLIVAASIFILTILIALLHQSQKTLGRAILEGLLIFFILDQNGAGILYSALAGAIIIAIVLWRKKSTLPFLGTAAFIAILVGLAGIGSAPKNDANKIAADEPVVNAVEPPALLHIIFDEHAGIEGLPADNDRSKALKAELQNFYIERGFRLYGRAYSEYFRTVNSIPQILNFGVSQDHELSPKDGIKLQHNAYFDFLRKKGYRMHVLQSDYLDYCSNEKIKDCETYGQASLSMLSRAPISIGQRAQFVAIRFSRLSPTFVTIGNAYLLAVYKFGKWGINLPSLGLNSEGRISALNAFLSTGSFKQELRNAKAGDAFFAHLLVPHYPYVLNSDCTIKSVDDWMLHRSASSRRLHENAYFDQIKCINKKLDTILIALEHSPAKDNFIVIVHGDHGSRITAINPTVENIGAFREDDVIAGFSTLFAIRAAGVKAGYINKAAPVSALLKDFTEKDFLEAPVAPLGTKGLVILDDVDWQPASSYSLPKAWLNDGADHLSE